MYAYMYICIYVYTFVIICPFVKNGATWSPKNFGDNDQATSRSSCPQFQSLLAGRWPKWDATMI